MKKVALAVAFVALYALGLIAVSCMGGGGGYAPHEVREGCDTTTTTLKLADGDWLRTVEIECTVIETVFVATPPDTVYVQPDWECVRECVELNGLGHWRECLTACIPAR